MGANVKNLPRKFLGKPKIVEFRNANCNLELPEIPRGKSNGNEIPGKKFSKLWVYLGRLYPFSEVPGNVVLLRRKFLEFKPECLVELKALQVDHFRKLQSLYN